MARILLLTHAFNGLAQRLFIELARAGHAVTVELDIADAVSIEAAELWNADLVIAPYLKRRIPEALWSRRLCLVVHPGPPGDRGPSALDWALLRGEKRWGVTVVQAAADFDAGAIWAWRGFDVPAGATKSGLYRHEVTTAAVQAVLDAVARWRAGSAQPVPPPELPQRRGDWQPLVTREQRRIDWAHDDAAIILRKVRSADASPGAVASLFGADCRLLDVHEASDAIAAAWRGPAPVPGQALARRGPALLVATRDAAVWVGAVRLHDAAGQVLPIKHEAARAFAAAAALPEAPAPLARPADEWDELRYDEADGVGWLAFDFLDGALCERRARRLLDALGELRRRPTRVLVLAGGEQFFCNGIHLHAIEAASAIEGDSAAEASWRQINAIDDVVLALLTMTDRLTVAALRGNAGAGGCFVALAADEVWLHEGVVLNPHYKNMGNLYGSEYWTYTLPRRVGQDAAESLMQRRWPTGGRQAAEEGLADACFGSDRRAFEALARERAAAIARAADLGERIRGKAERRAADEAAKPLAAYRDAELQRMRRNFFGFDPSYHVARHHFVHRKPHAWTPRHLALHR